MAQESKALSSEDYERMGKQLESLYDSVHPDRKALYKTAFIKGILGGVGGVIGATLVVALLLWALSLFDNIPLIGGFVDSIRHTIDKGTPQ
jgi:hypothetical protein